MEWLADKMYNHKFDKKVILVKKKVTKTAKLTI